MSARSSPSFCSASYPDREDSKFPPRLHIGACAQGSGRFSRPDWKIRAAGYYPIGSAQSHFPSVIDLVGRRGVKRPISSTKTG
jgi:hypothetical protein